MSDYEKEKLLRAIEEGLENSRRIIVQIDELLAQRNQLILARRLRGF
jgi:hypothetical protein